MPCASCVPLCGLADPVVSGRDNPEEDCGDEGCSKNGKNPGPDDALGNAPLDRRQPARGADADN